MWTEVPLQHPGKWPDGVRLPIIISVHHQSEEAAVVFEDGQVDPFDYGERQYGGRRGAWRLLEIMAKHGVRGTWIICGATLEKYPRISKEVKEAGHSIAGHTYEHEMMCNYPPQQERKFIEKTVSVGDPDHQAGARDSLRHLAFEHAGIHLSGYEVAVRRTL
jgi:peptidoglycan/xylan/chitin deacetylase (PgdA/CDA1 family)